MLDTCTTTRSTNVNLEKKIKALTWLPTPKFKLTKKKKSMCIQRQKQMKERSTKHLLLAHAISPNQTKNLSVTWKMTATKNIPVHWGVNPMVISRPQVNYTIKETLCWTAIKWS